MYVTRSVLLPPQAYYDIPGQMTVGGWGELDVQQFGYVLVGTVHDQGSFDTFALVLQHAINGRVVVSFRGSSSKKQWLNNLRFQQCEIDFSKLPDLHFGDEVMRTSAFNNTGPPRRHAQSGSIDDDDEEVLSGGDVSTQSSSSSQRRLREEREGARNPALHPNALSEAMATGAELVMQTRDLVREGVIGTAHLLGVDRLPYVRKLLRGHVHQV